MAKKVDPLRYGANLPGKTVAEKVKIQLEKEKKKKKRGKQ